MKLIVMEMLRFLKCLRPSVIAFKELVYIIACVGFGWMLVIVMIGTTRGNGSTRGNRTTRGTGPTRARPTRGH